jgi:hypothetical protein
VGIRTSGTARLLSAGSFLLNAGSILFVILRP